METLTTTLSKEELKDIGIRQWRDFGSQYEGADLLLGNGFSLNFTDGFGYDSLFEEFLSTHSPEDRQLFESFGTHNFEAIQKQLVGAKRVNQLFGLPTQRIEQAIETLQKGLLSAIKENHPPAAKIDFDELDEISRDLDMFGDVFTLSYDLYLYHIVLKTKDRHDLNRGVRRYNDRFYERVNDRFLKFNEVQRLDYDHVFYLHGALFIFEKGADTYKVRLRKEEDDELIGVIEDTIERGEFPLFVSEGTADDKRETIAKSPYLRFAMRKFKDCREKLVLFGVGLRQPDDHVVEAINFKRRQIAYAIHVHNRDRQYLESEMHRIRSKLTKHKLVFFDSRFLFSVI